MSFQTEIDLYRHHFSEREATLVVHGPLRASTFLYDSGVAALRLANELGELVMLPFQGQQVWSAHFLGRELTMRSMFATPRQTREYLENYGGFALHCGMTAMGVPGPEDHHPLHGELPNAAYQKAYLVVGEDEEGPYMGLGGQYEHVVAFNHHYLAEPLLKLYAGSSMMRLSLTVTNLKRTDMEYMYLAHINFRPVDDARLVYSARCTPETCKVRKSIPAHVRTKPGYRELLDELEHHPERADVLRPELVFDPEVVFTITYLADAEGWAHSLQLHPDGNADYVRHRPDQLNKGVRWICRTPDQDALGLVLPATAEPEGYAAEKAKGNVRLLPPGGQFHCDIEMGALTPSQALPVERHISGLLGG